MWYWRRMEKISWTNRVENKEVLHSVKEERNVPRTTQRETANWNGNTLRKNCLLTYVIERQIKGREDEEEEASSYWMPLRKREHTEI
jgi:hypothetical protein